MRIQSGEGLSWWWAERALRTQYDQLSDQVSPILSARNQALQTNRMATELGALCSIARMALLGQVAELLPKDSRLLAWRYRGSELDLRIGTDSVDPRLYAAFHGVWEFRRCQGGTFAERGAIAEPGPAYAGEGA